MQLKVPLLMMFALEANFVNVRKDNKPFYHFWSMNEFLVVWFDIHVRNNCKSLMFDQMMIRFRVWIIIFSLSQVEKVGGWVLFAQDQISKPLLKACCGVFLKQLSFDLFWKNWLRMNLICTNLKIGVFRSSCGSIHVENNQAINFLKQL